MSKYKAVIGLEMHCEMKSNSKVFSSARNDFSELANINVRPVDMAFPGTLPVVNKECVRKALLMSMVLNCKQPEYMYFDRKNYYYPDLPKGFQITQMHDPVGVDGNTLGFGMTFLHELHHTTIGGDYHDSTELFGTGPVVDNMNIIRNELNKQGFNYGERLNYKAIHTKEGNIIPFNESALTSLKYNSSMGKKAHYIKTK